MKRKSIYLVGLFILIVAISWFGYRAYEISSCTLKGGRLLTYPGPVGMRPNTYCYVYPFDEGKLCYQDNGCERDCIYEYKSDADNYLMGKCGTYNPAICTPHIPFKTNNTDDLVSGACI